MHLSTEFGVLWIPVNIVNILLQEEILMLVYLTNWNIKIFIVLLFIVRDKFFCKFTENIFLKNSEFVAKENASLTAFHLLIHYWHKSPNQYLYKFILNILKSYYFIFTYKVFNNFIYQLNINYKLEYNIKETSFGFYPFLNRGFKINNWLIICPLKILHGLLWPMYCVS